MPAAGGRTDQGYLNRMPSEQLPKEVVQDIFTKAQDESMLLRLGRQIPVSINETVIWTSGTFPEAGQVGGTTLASREGAEKPIQGIGFGESRAFSPIKLSVIVTVSEEFANYNPDQMYSELASKLSGACARAADLAAFHNKDAITGLDLIGTTANKHINATTNAVALDLTPGPTDPDLVTQIIGGVQLVESEVDGSSRPKNFRVNAFAADRDMRWPFVTTRTSDGGPVFYGAVPGTGKEINLSRTQGELFGLPLVYGDSVRGRLGAYAGSTARMFAGDWSQFAWGFADSISVRLSSDATVGGVSMFQTNQIAVLAECTFGWIVADPEAFVRYTIA